MPRDLATLLKSLDLDSGNANSLALRNLELAQLPTAEEQQADRLEQLGGQFKANTPVTAILKGLATGVAGAKRTKAEQERDARIQKIQEQIDYQQKIAEYQDTVKAKMNTAILADAEAMQTGKELANGLQALQLGDASVMQNWLAANPNVAKVMGDDGPGGHTFDGVTPINLHGVQYIQAFGKAPDGSPWQGKPIAVDALLQRYAPDVYASKTEAALKTAQETAELRKTQAEITKIGAETEKARAEAAGGGLDPKTRYSIEDRMADNFNSTGKPWRVVADFYQRGQAGYEAGQTGNPQGDMTLIFSYMKVLDPESAVREGEYANASQFRGVPESVVALYNKARDGSLLAPQQRDNISQQMDRIFASKAKQQLDIESATKQTAERRGLDASNITVGVPSVESISPTMLKPPPAPGTKDTTPSTPAAQTLPAPNLEAIDAELRKRGALK